MHYLYEVVSLPSEERLVCNVLRSKKRYYLLIFIFLKFHLLLLLDVWVCELLFLR